jgi:LDH2 family malate/lactate/ureidoglycolate dehydrogenase
MKISVTELENFCLMALKKAGVADADARTTADVLVTTDTWGIFTHGLKNLHGYIRRLQGGGLKRDAVPRMVTDGPAWAIVDGDSALGMVASVYAMRAAMAKARVSGISYVGVRNSCHFGAAGFYAAMAAREGLIGIAMCNDIPSVTVPGARGPVLGSNPLAFSVPTGDSKPILMDMATSTVAGGKVFAAAALGKRIPDHWTVDANGLPTNDPTLFPAAATLTPMAGHKGYGLALLIETLSAILTGAAITRQVLSWSFDDASLPTHHGAAFLAVNVDAMMPRAQFEQRVQQTIREIRASPKARGKERIYLPGEMEWERRDQALLGGIEYPEDALRNLQSLAREMDLDFTEI